MDNMVDETVDNHVDDLRGKPAWQLLFGLLGAFRTLVDEANLVLAERGHPGVRPIHGFALQAVGPAATASEVAARLGVSKQAAAKTIAMLEQEGYVARSVDPHDARRKVVVPTALGRSMLVESVQAFEDVVDAWRARVGDRSVDQLVSAIDRLGVAGSAKLDLGTWSS